MTGRDLNSETIARTGAAAIEIVDAIDQVDSQEWNDIIPSDCPFLRHEFLHAMEESGCVSTDSGWLPQHILIRNKASHRREVIGASPLYLKGHSFGEFIFDWDWAHGYQRHGLNYYPKLISQIPFTPISSPKLLTAQSDQAANTRLQLAHVAQEIARQFNVASIHWHFISDDDLKALRAADFLSRASTIEYVWSNPGYASMDEFLASLSSRKRKKIRSERQSVRDQGIKVTAIAGTEMDKADWQLVDRFYRQTVDKYHSNKYLSNRFFEKISQTMPERIVFFLARLNQNPVAGSFCLRGAKSLYGRYWGSLGSFRNLHFEVCYYAAIEYCIEQGLEQYNAGVQGEHKLNRGFLPKIARSCHSFSDPAFSAAIDRYISRETPQIEAYRDMLERFRAYSKDPTLPTP